jgi:predicted dehydrogenase/nucleoside-diphosphate-sugar epimerase
MSAAENGQQTHGTAGAAGSNSDRGTPRAPLRVAVVGCGAIARDFHVPVLAGHPDVHLAALVDRDRDAAQRLARQYDVAIVLTDVGQLAAGSVDAALVATPPQSHAAITIALLRRGVDVLVEKPMAHTAADAQAMVAAAEATGRVLSVGMFRRLAPASRLMRSAIDSGVLGEPLEFVVEEGFIYDWPSTTLALMRKELAGGGVLIDTGSHTLDQLLSFFDGPAALIEYRDNARGGIESDGRLSLRIRHRGRDVPGTVELSRTRNLSNRFLVRCEHGSLELATGERNMVRVLPGDADLRDPASGRGAPYRLTAEWEHCKNDGPFAAFRAQIDDWLQAIRQRRAPYLSGASAAPVIELIAQCYAERQELAEPWVDAGLPRVKAGGVSKPQRVLVTGSAGFIGCRVAEVLALGQGCDVRAMVHNPGAAGRVARLPVDLVQADLRNPADVDRAVAGCDAIVHCAYGTAWGDRKAIEGVTVGGTVALAEAALRHGVRRMVHLSTIAVHGMPVVDRMDESTAVRPPRGDHYAQSKARAERGLMRVVGRGLSAVMLRPAHVYGPYSGPYSIRPARDLLSGRPVLLGDGSNLSNSIYVDNLVEMIWRCLTAPTADVTGETFLAVDDDGTTWAELYGPLAKVAGVPMRSASLADLDLMRAEATSGSTLGRWLSETKSLLCGPEAIAWAKRLYQSHPYGGPARWVVESSPRLKERIQHALGSDAPFVYRPAGDVEASQPLELLELYAHRTEMRADKARRVLGYQPAVPRPQAIALTVDWLRYARYLPNAAAPNVLTGDAGSRPSPAAAT